MKTCRTFLQEMEKYALPPPPPPLPRQKKYKTQNSPKQSEITPIKRFSLATIRVSSRICNVGVCRKFYKKPNGSQEIEKNTLKESKKYPKMASRKGGLALKNSFSAVSILQ